MPAGGKCSAAGALWGPGAGRGWRDAGSLAGKALSGGGEALCETGEALGRGFSPRAKGGPGPRRFPEETGRGSAFPSTGEADSRANIALIFFWLFLLKKEKRKHVHPAYVSLFLASCFGLGVHKINKRT